MYGIFKADLIAPLCQYKQPKEALPTAVEVLQKLPAPVNNSFSSQAE